MIVTPLLRLRATALQDPQSDPSTAPTRSRGSRPEGDPISPGTSEIDPNGAGRPNPAGLEGCFESQTLIMLVGFVAIFYFLILRPQQKQEKQRRQMLAAIQRGDRVVTTGGLHGTVEALDGQTVTLRVDESRMVFDRAAVGRVLSESGGGEDVATSR